MTARPSVTIDRKVELFGAAVLALTAVLSLVLVLHHPALQGHRGVDEIAAAIEPLSRMDRIVHGGLIVIFGLQALGFCIFSATLGFSDPMVLSAFMTFAAGVIVMIIPATLDGFVTPDLAAMCLKGPQGCLAEDAGAFRLVAIMIQDFTKLALVSISVASGCWSIALLLRKGLMGRAAGGAGLACAVVTASILLFSNVHLKPANLAEFMTSQVVWALMVAGLMVSGDRAPARYEASGRKDLEA